MRYQDHVPVLISSHTAPPVGTNLCAPLLCPYSTLRPPLDKLSFPVHRVVKKRPVGRLEIFFFLNDFFLLTRMYRFFLGKKTFFSKNMEKKSSVGPFKPTRAVDRKQLRLRVGDTMMKTTAPFNSELFQIRSRLV